MASHKTITRQIFIGRIWGKTTPYSLLCLLFLLTLNSNIWAARQDPANPVEAGNVNWSRDLDSALELSKSTGKPLFVLFQEIPGCIGCQTFGSEVLTEPLLVEAIEEEFLPVLVYNNRPGTKDAAWLRRYREPSWNYQVIRFLGGDGKDIIPRKDRVWTISGVAARMIEALEKANRQVPLYLRTVMLEHDSANLQTVGFAMACFWTGEYVLGKIPGVIATEAGWYDNREVTLVTYHTQLLTLNSLVAAAAKEKCAQKVYLPPGKNIDKSRFDTKILQMEKYQTASYGDQKKQIQNWSGLWKIKSLTAMQATKINAIAPIDRNDALKWLSPRQRSLLQ